MTEVEIAKRARELIARADRVMGEAKTATREVAIKMLVDLGDELMNFGLNDLTVADAFASKELAHLLGEIEQRKDAVHRQWSGMTRS